MKFHSDTLNEQDFEKAARKAGVTIMSISKHGSRSRKNRFDVRLSGTSRYNAMAQDYKGATWDEWGIFIDALFEMDEEMTSQYYYNSDHFDMVTCDRFIYGITSTCGGNHKWEGSRPHFSCTKCDASMTVCSIKEFKDIYGL